LPHLLHDIAALFAGHNAHCGMVCRASAAARENATGGMDGNSRPLVAEPVFASASQSTI